MARIAGINIPPQKHAEIGLTAIYGIGRTTAQKICDSCGTAVHIDNDKLSDGVRAAADATGFAAERPVIEVRGKCAECQ